MQAQQSQALANEFGLRGGEGGAVAGLLGAGLTADELRGIHGAATRAGFSPHEYLPMATGWRRESGVNGQNIAAKFSGF